ncbi:MAG: hypothetical protein H6702_01415 [Myxococcales bacterium]|nr:hypothetical protein [Myxococcales bacterium]
MSDIKGPRPIGGPRPAPGDGAALGRAEAATGVAPAAAPDPMVAMFEAVKTRFPGGVQPADRPTAVRAVVDEVLGREMGHLAEPTRAGVAERVTQALLTHPDLAARLDRLLAQSSG